MSGRVHVAALIFVPLAITACTETADGTGADGGDAGGGDGAADGPVDVAMESPPTCASSAVCVAGDRPVCDPGSKMCRACKDGAECLAKDPARPLCDTAGGACVACLTAAACTTPAAPICDAASRSCRKCTGGAECLAKDPARPVCDAAAGSCHECLADADCQGAGKAAGKPVCDKTSRTCRACGADAECTGMSAALRACLTSGAKTGQCAECDDDTACNADGKKPICELTSYACRKCATGNECSTKTSGMLRGCATDGGCVECTKNTECAAPTAVCDPTAQKCVACLTSADCTYDTGNPICDTATHTCKPCQSDAECADKGGGPGVCMWHQDHRCATDAETIYVQDKSGCSDSGPGSSATPLCGPTAAKGKLTSTRRVVVVRGIVENLDWTIAGTATQVTVIGQSTAAISKPSQPGVHVSGSGIDLYMRDVRVTGSLMAQGIHTEGSAVIRLDRVRVDNNAKGGLQAEGAGFDVRNCIIVDNGAGLVGAAGFGGAYLASAAGGKPAAFAFNTVASNEAAGVACEDSSQSLDASLLAGNTSFDHANCSVPSSTQIGGEPMFGTAYHLTSASPCRNAVSSPADPPGYDIDGDARPMGGKYDCGADEYEE